MFKNLVWDFFGKFSVQLIGFGISVLLTRLLSPAEFGVMGMAMAVIVIAHIFLDLGFNRAIIQQAEVTDTQYSTIFYLNVFIAILLTLICYGLASPMAQFYQQPLIKPVFRVLSVIFLINGLNLVPSAILYKRLQFKLNSVLNIISSLAGGLTGVYLAWKGYGVWSLVVQSMLTSLLVLLTNFIYARWWPLRAFSLAAIKPLWAYGSRMFASGLLDTVYTRLDIFIIGRLFTVSTLGFYTRAQSMDNFVRQLSVNSIMSALFPYIALQQHDRLQIGQLYKRYLHIISFIAIALSGTLFLGARYIFVILFSARWLYAAELFQLMSLIGFAWPVSSLMCNVISGVGNSRAFLRLEVYKKLLFLPVYLLGFLLGLKGFIYFFILANLISVGLNAAFVSREISFGLLAQLRVIGTYFLVAIVSAALAYGLHYLIHPSNYWISVLVLAAVFNLLYFLSAWLFRLAAFDNLILLLTKFQTYLYDKRHKNLPAAL